MSEIARTTGPVLVPYLRHVLRRLPLSTLGAAALLAGGFVWVSATRQHDPLRLVGYLRAPTVVLAASAAPFLDDVAAPMLDVTSHGRGRRRALDALVGFTLVLALWAAVALVALVIVDGTDPVRQFPWGASLIEVAAMTMFGFVTMIVVTQVTGPGSGGRVALVTGIAALGSLTIPQTNAWLWPTKPYGSAWRDAHVRWIVLAAVVLGAITVLSRDPARRTRHSLAG